MIAFYNQVKGRANVYTMDHRGTGRSTLFDCVAAQSTTSGSPGGSGISVREVPSCAAALQDKYGSDLASFSVTSAATDLYTFISTFTKEQQTFVYGVSYGTALVERLMHLAPEEVVGYIMDGIATSSGSSRSNVEYFSRWDSDYGEVADGFLAKCADDAFCSSKFADKSLPDTLKDLIDNFDANPTSSCAALVQYIRSGVAGEEGEPASYSLRKLLGSLFMDADARTLIPVLTYRLSRCSSDDQDILTYLAGSVSSYTSGSYEDEKFESTLLYNLIVYSEMWEQPEPSAEEMLNRFTNYSVTNGGTYANVAQYCAFSKEDSDVCNEYGVADYSAPAILYARDEYWNEAATIPSQASVLLLSSKMDPQTPHKYAEYLLDALDGSSKELITFEHATHGTIWTTPVSEYSSTTCGMTILVSYVSAGGDLEQLDKSCLSDMPELSFDVPIEYQYILLSTSDAYDGSLDPSISSSFMSSASSASGASDSTLNVSSVSNGSSHSYKAAFIVFLVLFILAVVVGSFAAVRWYRKRRESACQTSGSSLPTVVHTPTSSPTSTGFQQRS